MEKPHTIRLLANTSVSVNTIIDLRIIENNSDTNVVVDTNNQYIVIYTHRERTLNKYRISFTITWDDYKLISPLWHWGLQLDFGGGITYDFIPSTNYQITSSKIDPTTNKPDINVVCDGFLESSIMSG
jgi:hypothetical protein